MESRAIGTGFQSERPGGGGERLEVQGWGQTHLNHAKTLLVVSTGDFEHITRELITEAISLNSLQQRVRPGSKQERCVLITLAIQDNARAITWLIRLS
jgi:hypothetical protein